MEEWYYKRNDTEYGPIGAAHLQAMQKRGTLKADTPVRHASSQTWIPLQQAHLVIPPQVASPPPASQRTDLSYDSPAASPVYAPPAADLLACNAEKVPRSLWLAVIIAAIVIGTSAYLRLTEVLILICQLAGIQTESMPETIVWLAIGYHWISVIDPALIFILLFALLAWQGAAFASLRHLYGDAMMHHGPASGLWWITPFANLVMPFFCLRELRYLSRRRRDNPQYGIPFGPVLWALEILIVWNVIARFLFRPHTLPESYGHSQSTSIPLWMEFIDSFVGLSFTTLLLVIIIGNLRLQIRLYQNWDA